jgi:hypothetical protein
MSPLVVMYKRCGVHKINFTKCTFSRYWYKLKISFEFPNTMSGSYLLHRIQTWVKKLILYLVDLLGSLYRNDLESEKESRAVTQHVKTEKFCEVKTTTFLGCLKKTQSFCMSGFLFKKVDMYCENALFFVTVQCWFKLLLL